MIYIKNVSDNIFDFDLVDYLFLTYLMFIHQQVLLKSR